MSKRTEQTALKRKGIKISARDYERILMWSQSKKEIIFICFGKGNSIEIVERLVNISSSPSNHASWSYNQSKPMIKLHQKHLKIIAFGHSHPSKGHNRHPSNLDVENTRKGSIELIAFPHEGIVRAWIIGKSVAQTKQQEISLEVIR